MVHDESQHIIKSFLLDSPSWKEGYHSFKALLGNPRGWVIEIMDDLPCGVTALDRKTNEFGEEFLRHYESRLRKFSVAFVKSDAKEFPKRSSLGRFASCYVFRLEHVDVLKGFLVLCSLGKEWAPSQTLLSAFKSFVSSEIDLALRNYEIKNFYETIHPRALALSTMHAVHRAMSSTLKLDELIPRIGRLSMQVLKARYCGICLVDEMRKHLIPKFVCQNGVVSRSKVRHRIGHGIEGTVAETAAFHLNRHSISVPLIEEDIIGVITLRDKIDNTPFSKVDLEILRALSEQTASAIKTAQLYEETEQLTLGSIKSINELLELSYANEAAHTPFFIDLAVAVAKDLGMLQEGVKNLERAVALLNTGYAGIPKKILAKRGRLSAKELELIHRHPYRGAAVLSSIGSLKPVVPIVLHHHEHFDGTGYPGHLRGDEIPLGARVVAVVDAFTAMLSKRPYRSAKTVTDAIREIKASSGRQFDPKVVRSFLKIEKDKNMENLK
ncbi:MAG: HD domain-containing protein [Candidatus Omnitrophica bacterium]|nr:HD domain-containing protein [Candidatus Omnitrophota bacterium]